MTSSDMQIKNLTSRIQTLRNELNISIQGKVATLTSQIEQLSVLSDTLTAQIDTLKVDAHIYSNIRENVKGLLHLDNYYH